MMLSPESTKSEWLSKKRQMQGAQLSRNDPVTRAFPATQQLVSFCEAIMNRSVPNVCPTSHKKRNTDTETLADIQPKNSTPADGFRRGLYMNKMD
jgi:hypothetical protein